MHVLDASKAVGVASQLLSDDKVKRAAYLAEIKANYEQMRIAGLNKALLTTMAGVLALSLIHI